MPEKTLTVTPVRVRGSITISTKTIITGMIFLIIKTIRTTVMINGIGIIGTTNALINLIPSMPLTTILGTTAMRLT